MWQTECYIYVTFSLSQDWGNTCLDPESVGETSYLNILNGFFRGEGVGMWACSDSDNVNDNDSDNDNDIDNDNDNDVAFISVVHFHTL